MLKINITLPILVLTTLFSLAQNESLDLLNRNAINLEEFSVSTFDKIYPFFQNSQIIGLGEATHGTQDFNVARIELIKYLIEYQGLKTIVFEAQFNKSQRINDYLIHNEGTPENAVKYLVNGFWHTRNMIDFLKWIHNYNQYKLPEQKVRYFGCDISAPQYALYYIEKYLQGTGNLDSSLTEEFNWFIKNRQVSHDYTAEEKSRLNAIKNDLNSAFSGMKPEGNSELRLVLQYKRLFEQYLEMINLKNGFRKSVRRDRFMAENVEFIFNYTNQKKMIIWAHNNHLARKSGHTKLKPLGNHLSKKFNSTYYCLATAFNKGSFYAYDYDSKQRKSISLEEASEDSYDMFFSQCMYPRFFLNLRNNEIPELDKKSSSRNIGAGHNQEKNRNYRRHFLTDSYDGILFFNETKAVEYLPINEN